MSQAELEMLDQLDRADRGVKVEVDNDVNLRNPSREPNVIRNLKREREDSTVRIKREGSGSGSRKRSRMSGSIETVDLTED